MVEDTDHLIDEINAATLAETRRPEPTPAVGRSPIEPVFRYTRVKPCGCDDDGTVCLHGIPAALPDGDAPPAVQRPDYLGVTRSDSIRGAAVPIGPGHPLVGREALRAASDSEAAVQAIHRCVEDLGPIRVLELIRAAEMAALQREGQAVGRADERPRPDPHWERHGCPVHGEDCQYKIGVGGFIRCATCGEKIIELPKKET